MQKKKLAAMALGVMMAMSCMSCTGAAEVDPSTTQPVGTTEGGEVTEGELHPDGGDLSDGTVILNETFEDPADLDNWGSYTNAGSMQKSIEDGQLKIEILDPGVLEYGCQCFRDGFALHNQCVYECSFDIYSDIERDIEWRFQVNGGDFHPYYMESPMRVTTEKTTVDVTFTMEEASDPAPRLCFNLGAQGNYSSGPSIVYVDNFKLVIKDGSNAVPIEPLPDPKEVRVNQVGYKPDDIKVIIAKAGADSFDVVDEATGNVVYTGKLGEKMMPKSGGFEVCNGEFSDFTTPGTYHIAVNGVGESYPFTIADNVYDDLFTDSVKMLTLQRCGCKLDEALAGDYAHEACHTDMATVYGTDTQIDVSGGWHDAGDYGRYVVAGAKAIMDLFLTYENNEASRGDDFGIPESGNDVPDILDEARYELEWMLKMQNEEGGVYHKVTCAVFPETVGPCEETDPLIVCPVSTAATGDFAAVMARASVLYKEYDAEFAAKCLDAAKKAGKYLDANALDDKVGFTNPEDIVTGEYNDGQVVDEYFWAMTELFAATGDASYNKTIVSLNENNFFKPVFGWANVGGYGMYTYVMSDVSGKNKDLETKFKDSFVSMANDDIAKMEKFGFNVAMGVDFPWGSNMTVANNGFAYQIAYMLTGDEQYNRASRVELDYLLGVNQTAYCYVTGYGTYCPEHVHHRPSQVAGVSTKGMLVGGPNSNADDPYAKSVLHDAQGGFCYVDNDSSYSTNEVTIYWNSPLTLLLSFYK